MLPIKPLSASRPYSIPPLGPLDGACEERLARPPASCAALRLGRLAVAADPHGPRTLPQRLRLVAMTDRVTLL